jgi:hypothetical protein
VGPRQRRFRFRPGRRFLLLGMCVNEPLVRESKDGWAHGRFFLAERRAADTSGVQDRHG